MSGAARSSRASTSMVASAPAKMASSFSGPACSRTPSIKCSRFKMRSSAPQPAGVTESVTTRSSALLRTRYRKPACSSFLQSVEALLWVIWVASHNARILHTCLFRMASSTRACSGVSPSGWVTGSIIFSIQYLMRNRLRHISMRKASAFMCLRPLFFIYRIFYMLHI